MPGQLPTGEDLVWEAALPSEGLGGICVADGTVFTGSRDAGDQADVYTAHDLATGDPLWTFRHPAPLDADYGNAPRATPAFSDGLVFVLGAGGHVHALDAATGLVFWTVDLAERFKVPAPTWGFSSSPIVFGDRLLMQVGGDVRAVALDVLSGETVWTTAGKGLPHASFVKIAESPDLFAGTDHDGHFAVDGGTGRVVWSDRPEYFEEFGVPSAVVVDGAVVFTGENTGLRSFPLDGEPAAGKPAAVNDLVTPDSHTPVFAGGLLLVAFEGLRGIDPRTLEERWVVAADDVRAYASVIASDRRALVTTEAGDLVLVAFDRRSATVLDRGSLTDGGQRVLSHPAVTGDRVIFRVGRELRCFRLPM